MQFNLLLPIFARKRYLVALSGSQQAARRSTHSADITLRRKQKKRYAAGSISAFTSLKWRGGMPRILLPRPNAMAGAGGGKLLKYDRIDCNVKSLGTKCRSIALS
jgi:hypothetical protein